MGSPFWDTCLSHAPQRTLGHIWRRGRQKKQTIKDQATLTIHLTMKSTQVFNGQRKINSGYSKSARALFRKEKKIGKWAERRRLEPRIRIGWYFKSLFPGDTYNCGAQTQENIISIMKQQNALNKFEITLFCL